MLYCLLVAVILPISLAAGACPVPAGTKGEWIDSTTPADACTKPVCTGSYQQCSAAAAASKTENLALVFSDEFSSPARDFRGQTGDQKWTAMDMYYSSDYREWQNYKPDKVSVSNGALQIVFADENTTATLNSVNGSVLGVPANKTSGMVQSWNKFCFTGGYAEFGIKLPGTARDSGLWAAAWLNGNLGRAGHLRSTWGRWPYSYDLCEGSGVLEWSKQPGQRTSRCAGGKGRGAPEIDVLEYGIFPPPWDPTPLPTYVHTMQMAPIAPLFTSWMLEQSPGSGNVPGVHLPGASNPATKSYLGVPYGEMNRAAEGFPRMGTALTDTYSASSLLGAQHFAGYHKYAVLWEPGEFVRWYLDDELLFEVNKEALRGFTNAQGQSIGERIIPKEAMYIIINVAMADTSWARVSEALLQQLQQSPAVMSVDYVRVWQRPNAVNVGCDPPEYPTQQEIACNKEEFLSPEELDTWRLGPCGSISSQDNVLLLSFGSTVAGVTLGALGMMYVMQRHMAAAKAADGQFSLEEQKAAAASNRQAGCYMSTNKTAEAVMQTRPDLLAIAAARTSGSS